MSDDINPLAPAEDAEQEEAGEIEEAAVEPQPQEPAEFEPPRAVDQRHPQSHVGYAK